MDLGSKIYIVGYRGMVGSKIVNNLVERGYNNLVVRSHDELDLTNQNLVSDFFSIEQPDYVILAAAKVGYFC